MSVRMKIAFVFHMLATILLVCFGVTYLLRTEFMPYHSVAVGMAWEQVLPPFRVLILALMRAFGGCCIGVVILIP